MNISWDLGKDVTHELLIENLGGYERAKEVLELIKARDHKYAQNFERPALEKALLQYRREHGIYEVGDKVVYHSLPHARLFYVKAVLDDSIVVRECWDEAGAKCFSEFEPYLDIRHATDAEIKVGHRLEVG